MASMPRTYTDTLTDNRRADSSTVATPYERTGGPRDHFWAAMHRDRNERSGSHMPLDTSIHWEWNNPLNILPALILVFLAVAIIAMVLA